MKLLAINTIPGDRSKGEFGLAALPGRANDFIAAFGQSLAYCRVSGAKAIHVMAGVVPHAQRETARATLLENLAKVTKRAEKEGCTILLEPINPRDVPDYFYSTCAEVSSVIKELGSSTVRMMFDVYHTAISEGDVIMKMRAHRDLD